MVDASPSLSPSPSHLMRPPLVTHPPLPLLAQEALLQPPLLARVAPLAPLLQPTPPLLAAAAWEPMLFGS